MLVQLAGPEDMDEVFALRREVFVVGQGVPEELERDALDAVSLHAVARCEGQVVGTGRLVPPGLLPAEEGVPAGSPHAAVVGRLAVADAHRGTGVGVAVLALLEAGAAERGWTTVELHAQTHALGFYERAGYAAFGEVYLEAGIEHQSMRKELPHREAPAAS